MTRWSPTGTPPSCPASAPSTSTSRATGRSAPPSTPATGSADLAGPSPVFFFAPDRITKRGADWGTARLDGCVAEAWAPFARWASAWLRVDRASTEDVIQQAYLELLDGTVDPTAGTVVVL